MATLTLTFSAPLNVSCQVGDFAYYVSTSSSGGFTINSGSVAELGTITTITNPTTNSPTIVCDDSNNTTATPGSLNGTTKFILFSKDNKANLSSILGYYADVKFVCDDETDAEIYSAGVDTFESSK